jgi:hypothetical protein
MCQSPGPNHALSRALRSTTKGSRADVEGPGQSLTLGPKPSGSIGVAQAIPIVQPDPNRSTTLNSTEFSRPCALHGGVRVKAVGERNQFIGEGEQMFITIAALIAILCYAVFLGRTLYFKQSDPPELLDSTLNYWISLGIVEKVFMPEEGCWGYRLAVSREEAHRILRDDWFLQEANKLIAEEEARKKQC